MANGTPASPGPLADRLNHLFATVRRPDGRPYTNQEVAETITASGTATLSHNYLHSLRNGQRGQTGRTARDKLHAIAGFFGVPTAYFDDPAIAAEVDEQLDLIALLRDNGVRMIAMQATGMPRPLLEAMINMLKATRTALGLPPADSTEVPAPRRGN